MITKFMTSMLMFLGTNLASASANQSLSTLSACPTKPQKILVLDLKSGWWGGDGGDFHQTIARKLDASCPGAAVFEFRHTPYGSFSSEGLSPMELKFGVLSPSGRRHAPTAFINGQVQPELARTPPIDWNSYQQIWLLSGGEADSADMRIDSDEFKGILAGIASTTSSVFIGTGFGNIYHANSVSAQLGLGVPFHTSRVSDIYPMPSNVSTLTWLEKDINLVDHVLFKNITHLPDSMKVGGYDLTNDWIVDDGVAGLQILAKQNDVGVIATSCGACGQRLAVLDAGMHRFYGVVGDAPETLEYLLSILTYLQQ